MSSAASAAEWVRVRRYAVPRWMIDEVARCRSAGDWRGACAAAGVDVAFDLAEVAAEHGVRVAEVLEDDLRHLAPDLIRWHLPRARGGRTTLAPKGIVVLSGQGSVRGEVHLSGYAAYAATVRGGRDGPGRRVPVLYLRTPPLADGPQRLTLCFGTLPSVHVYSLMGAQDWSAARHLWDVRHSDELRERCGGNAARAPFHTADGRPEAPPASDPGTGDPARHTEWVTHLQDRGDVEAALAAAGIDCARSESRAVLDGMPLALSRLVPEMATLGEQRRYQIPLGRWNYTADNGSALVLDARDGRLRVELAHLDHRDSVPRLPEACWRRSPDLDLLRSGLLGPEDLHPLVRGALFPARRVAAAGPPPPPPVPEPVRIRCDGEWHEASFDGGVLRVPHTETEAEEKLALHALGGTVTGCFEAWHGWTDGSGRLPRKLRELRRDLLLRVRHGDTPGLLCLLDAGVSPRLRDARGRTLLHMLNRLDHDVVLPRLLAAGLHLDARDRRGLSPLHVAIGEHGSLSLVRALLAAGATMRFDDLENDVIADYVQCGRPERDTIWALLFAEAVN